MRLAYWLVWAGLGVVVRVLLLARRIEKRVIERWGSRDASDMNRNADRDLEF